MTEFKAIQLINSNNLIIESLELLKTTKYDNCDMETINNMLDKLNKDNLKIKMMFITQ